MSLLDTIMAQQGWPALYRVFGDTATIARTVGDPQTCPVILTRNLSPHQVEGVHVTNRDALARLRWSDLGTALNKGDTLTIDTVLWAVQRCVQEDEFTVTYLVRRST